MSSATLRYQTSTISFLPTRRERQLSHAVRAMKTRMSRRRVKQTLRNLMHR